MKKLFLIAGLGAALVGNAFAAKSVDLPAAACEGIKVATGPSGKGYSKVYRDLAKECAVVPTCEVQTTGGLDNLNAMSTKKADIGEAQLDTWLAMKNGDENIGNLVGLMALNSNYLHTVVAAGGYTVVGEKKYGFLKGDSTQVVIQRFSDLRGKRVALVGSAQLLGRQLNKTLGYAMDIVDVDTDAAAFAMVKAGSVAAAFAVSGWPSGSIEALKQDSGLSLVPFDAAVSSPYTVKSINYRNLGVYNSNALAISNILFTRPFKGDKAIELTRLKQCVVARLEALKEGDYEPAWNEIKSLDSMGEVPPFQTVGGPVAISRAAPPAKSAAAPRK